MALAKEGSFIFEQKRIFLLVVATNQTVVDCFLELLSLSFLLVPVGSLGKEMERALGQWNLKFYWKVRFPKYNTVWL